jgi:D-arabinose 1-dehydrogenase-like Zn-dependent alcohol dehydrogenase
VFFLQLEILGSTMGTRDELGALLSLCATQGIRPIVDSTYGFSEVREAFERLDSGEVFGKVVLDHSR